MVWSVLRHRQRDLYIALLTVLEPGNKTTRLATALSNDLLNWTKPRIIDGINIQQTKICDENPVYVYPSLVDPESPDRNFDTTNDDAVLFLTSIHRQECKYTLDRDLVLRHIRFIFD